MMPRQLRNNKKTNARNFVSSGLFFTSVGIASTILSLTKSTVEAIEDLDATLQRDERLAVFLSISTFLSGMSSGGGLFVLPPSIPTAFPFSGLFLSSRPPGTSIRSWSSGSGPGRSASSSLLASSKMPSLILMGGEISILIFSAVRFSDFCCDFFPIMK